MKRHCLSGKEARRKKRSLFAGEAFKPCVFCGKQLTLAEATLEHIIPLAYGGVHALHNLAISCSSCNRARGTIPFHMYKAERVP